MLLALFAAANLASAQSRGSVRVTILLVDDGAPLPDMQVTLSGGGLIQPRVLTTNDRGEVCFLGIPSGDGYILAVDGVAFQPKRGSIGHVYAGFTRHFVGHTGIIRPEGCTAIEWRDVAFPAPGVFTLPLPEQPRFGVCL